MGVRVQAMHGGCGRGCRCGRAGAERGSGSRQKVVTFSFHPKVGHEFSTTRMQFSIDGKELHLCNIPEMVDLYIDVCLLQEGSGSAAEEEGSGNCVAAGKVCLPFLISRLASQHH